MPDLFNEEIRKAIERYRIENKRRTFELNRRCGKTVVQQVQMDQQISDALRYSILPSPSSITIAGTPPVTPDVWRREYCAELASTSETEGEQVVTSITTKPSKGVSMIEQAELIDMALFESSGFFNFHELEAIKDRTKEQGSNTINDFAHVCFTANGGAFAFVIVRKSDRTIHSRIFGIPHNSSEQTPLSGSAKTVTVGKYSIIQDSYAGIGGNRLSIPYDYCNVLENHRWTDGQNGSIASVDRAKEVFNDCLGSFKQAEEEGMIQNLSIASTCHSYYTAVKDIKQPVIKLMDLELF